MAISTAIGIERVSRVSGYKIKKGFFDESTKNLPQVIAVFGEANESNQNTITNEKREITSSDEAGRIYGYGSPIHQMMRILRPITSDGVGGIPTIVFPQISDSLAVSAKFTWEVIGTATANATHTMVINGRESIDFKDYSYQIVIGDTPDKIVAKMVDAINNVLGSPVIATIDHSTKICLTAKWKGETSNQINQRVEMNGVDAGITYVQQAVGGGSGSVDLDESFSQIEDEWITAVINPYQDKVSNFEDFNGFPFQENPTGRYQGRVFKPFMAYIGTKLKSKDDLVSQNQSTEKCTTVYCVAPRTDAFEWEIATNAVLLFAKTMQDTPEIDINGMSYPDLPAPKSMMIGDMSDYNNRDYLVKHGISTVILDKGLYKVQDFVTSYCPEGEYPLQYSYCRNLNIDWNIADAYRILEKMKVKDRVLIRDGQVTSSTNAIRPKEWKSILFTFFDSLAMMALINDPEFSKQSLRVAVSSINPNRFETFFRYRRTGVARIESTDVEAGF